MPKKPAEIPAAVENIRSTGTNSRIRNHNGGPAVRNIDSDVDVHDAETSSARPFASAVSAIKRRHLRYGLFIVLVLVIVLVGLFAPDRLSPITNALRSLFSRN